MTKRSLSLIEQKKLQWSREREEMTKFYGLWSPTNNATCDKKKASSSCSLEVIGREEEYDSTDYFSDNKFFPPIQKSIFNEYIRNDAKNTECNTSGYVSESDTKDQLNSPHESQKQWRSQSSLCSDRFNAITNNSFKDDANISRPKWGDRGIGIGYLWEPTSDVQARLPEINNNRPGTPHWLQKTLSNKNYLRGQSVPIEPSEVHEREKKRLKAVELQEAIRQQLLEREKKRILERDRQLEEERKLEQRIKEHQQIEKNRMDEEIKKQKEKEEKENKKTKVMMEALATAQKEAKEAKSKLKSKLNENFKRFETDTAAQGIDDDSDQMTMHDQDEYSKEVEKCNEKLQPKNISCDAQTSLTAENYFEEFKWKIPLIVSKGTQTSAQSSPVKSRRKMNSKSNSDRPKWGVNRPNTKYMKQSEKDIFYQRKLKHRFYRRRFTQDPSGSSRSIDSTDECKSLSSSPNEKDMSTILHLEKFKNTRKSSNSSDTDQNTMAIMINSDYNELVDRSISDLENEKSFLDVKQSPRTKTFWEKEMRKMSTDFVSAISLPEE